MSFRPLAFIVLGALYGQVMYWGFRALFYQAPNVDWEQIRREYAESFHKQQEVLDILRSKL